MSISSCLWERGERWLEGGGLHRKHTGGPNMYIGLLYEVHLKQQLLTDHRDVEVEDADNTLVVIRNDVPRSFGTILKKMDSKQAREDLYEVLTVFNHYMPRTYTQGMNFIVAVALAHMDKENAFWLLVDLVESLPEGFFTRTALDEVELFGEIVSNYAPIIKEHLEEEHDDTSFKRAMGYLLVQWMVPLFVHVLPFETVLRIWDFLFERKKESNEELILGIHRVAFALLEVHSGPLLSKHRQVGEALSLKTREEYDPELYSELTNTYENTSGIEFVQRVLLSASNDVNVNRIIKLAKEVTIDPSWLNQVRTAQTIERSSSKETELSNTEQPLVKIEKSLSGDDDIALAFLACVGVRENAKEKRKEEKERVKEKDDDDCVIS